MKVGQAVRFLDTKEESRVVWVGEYLPGDIRCVAWGRWPYGATDTKTRNPRTVKLDQLEAIDE